MKRVIILVSVVCLLSYSCSEEDKKTLTLSTKGVKFTSDGGDDEIIVSANTNWEVSYGANWFEVETTGNTGNGKITIRAQANDKSIERTANIIVTAMATGMNEEIIVTQEAGPVKYLVKKITYDYGYSQEFDYDANRITTIKEIRTGNPEIVSTFEYAPNGDLLKFTDGNVEMMFQKTGNIISMFIDGVYEGNISVNADNQALVLGDNFFVFTYNAGGNVATAANAGSTYTCEYDNKISPYAYLNTPSWLLTLFFHVYGLSNNSTKGVERVMGYTIPYTATYEYNEDDYPTKQTKTRDRINVSPFDYEFIPELVVAQFTYVEAE